MAWVGTARGTWKVGLQSPEMETPSDRKPGAQTGGPGWQSGHALSTWGRQKAGPGVQASKAERPQEKAASLPSGVAEGLRKGRLDQEGGDNSTQQLPTDHLPMRHQALGGYWGAPQSLPST